MTTPEKLSRNRPRKKARLTTQRVPDILNPLAKDDSKRQANGLKMLQAAFADEVLPSGLHLPLVRSQKNMMKTIFRLICMLTTLGALAAHGQEAPSDAKATAKATIAITKVSRSKDEFQSLCKQQENKYSLRLVIDHKGYESGLERNPTYRIIELIRMVVSL